jgi:predicted GTPase
MADAESAGVFSVLRLSTLCVEIARKRVAVVGDCPGVTRQANVFQIAADDYRG